LKARLFLYEYVEETGVHRWHFVVLDTPVEVRFAVESREKLSDEQVAEKAREILKNISLSSFNIEGRKSIEVEVP
jgi:hypothetical protein